MTTTAEYQEWVSSGPTSRGIIDTVEIYHPLWGSIFAANWGAPVSCYIEDNKGSIQTPQFVEFGSTRFFLEPSEVSDGTQQVASIGLAAFDGKIYDELRAMTAADRSGPDSAIRIIPRTYWTDTQSKQHVNPPPRWNAHNIIISLEAVKVELSVLPLRVHRTGIYYTAQEFPVLRMIQ